MSKAQTWDNVQEVLNAQSRLPKGLFEALETILAPKSSGTVNPPKEIDGVMHYYCRFHKEYEPQENMVMSNGKSKGYCKASISVWNKRNSAIKRQEAEISELVMAGDFEQAQMCTVELKQMKDDLNDSSTYDRKRDWEAFTKPKEEVVEETKEEDGE